MGAGLFTGFGLGFLVAAQVGPIWLLCARSVLRGRLMIGVAIGAGAALVDLLYAAFGVAGATELLRIAVLREALGLAGAAVLIYLGVKGIHSALRIRSGLEVPSEVATPWAAFRTALVATASNPMTIASWAAIFTAATVGASLSPVLTVLGVGIGSFSWFLLLSTAASLVRTRVNDLGLRAADFLAGLGLVGFGLVLGLRSLDGR